MQNILLEWYNMVSYNRNVKLQAAYETYYRMPSTMQDSSSLDQQRELFFTSTKIGLCEV